MYYDNDDSEQYDWYDESYVQEDKQEDSNEPISYYDFG